MKLLTRILRKQAGQALPMALVLLTIGAMVIVPTLILTQTNLTATTKVDQHTRELYAADAGIDHALWHLQSDARLQLLTQGHTLPYNYELNVKIPGEQINLKDVQINIESAWLLSNYRPMGLTPLPATEPLPSGPTYIYYANDHWTTVGAINIDNKANYIVDINTTENAATSYVDHIGVWLPQGYSYVTGTVRINNIPIGGPGTNNSLVQDPIQDTPYRGGTALIWSYANVPFQNLSNIAPLPVGGQPPAAKFPPSIRLSFTYTNNPVVTPLKEARGFFPWIRLNNQKISWDADAGFFHVQSTGITSPTDNTTIEAYVPRGVVRYVSGASGASSAIQGDYIAIGNSLMTCCWASDKKTPPVPPAVCNSSACTTCCTDNPYRNYAPAPVTFTTAAGYTDGERESYAIVNDSGADVVPSDAKIERAYLYWTAWLRGDKVWLESSAPGHGTGSWLWTQYMGDDTNWESHAPQNVKDWLSVNAYDGKAYLAVSVNGGPSMKVTPVNAGDRLGTVIADRWFISEGSNNVQPSYQYSCFADVTAQVTAITTALRKTKFTVAGVHAHPAFPHSGGICDTSDPTIDWSRSPNAGWSMVIIYSSAAKKTHQIYLYEGCEHLYNATRELTITGFAAPLAADLQSGETNEAKMTVFASEGDVNQPTPAEYLGFRGQQNPAYTQLYGVSGTPGVYTADVFNSISSAGGFTASTINTCQAAGQISGIDIDTYTTTNPSGGTYLYTIVRPGDTSANIRVQSLGDGFEVIYVVFSVRSTAIPAGTEFNVGTMLYRIQ